MNCQNCHKKKATTYAGAVVIGGRIYSAIGSERKIGGEKITAKDVLAEIGEIIIGAECYVNGWGSPLMEANPAFGDVVRTLKQILGRHKGD